MSENTLKQFYRISQEMLVVAELKQWERLPALEQERQVLMREYFENTDSDNTMDSNTVQQVIENVLKLNQKIEHLAQQQKQDLSQAMSIIKKRQNINTAYLQNT